MERSDQAPNKATSSCRKKSNSAAAIKKCSQENWSDLDLHSYTGNGCMIDLEHPGNNGYENFKDYLHQINSR